MHRVYHRCGLFVERFETQTPTKCRGVGCYPQLSIDEHLGNLHLPNDLARVIHNAGAGLLDRYVQSSKMVHAALLLLMLEALPTDLVSTISLKRSTQNLQLSTSSPADYPIFEGGRRHHKLESPRLRVTLVRHSHSIESQGGSHGHAMLRARVGTDIAR